MKKPTAVKKILFLNYIKLLYKVLLYTGLIHFKYNLKEKRVKCSFCKRFLSLILHGAVALFYGALVWWSFGAVLAIYVNFIQPPDFDEGSELIQDILLKLSLVFLRIFSTYIFAHNYLRRRHCLLPIVNELLDIFNRLAPFTDSLIYFDSNFLPFIFLKMYFTALRLHQEYNELLPAAYLLKELLVPYSYLICVTMNLTCICFQMVLICFYMKMNEVLVQCTSWGGNGDVAKVLRKFIAISNRIHRVKKQLDGFYMVLFIAAYTGFFHDIYYSYHILQIFLYVEKDTPWFHVIVVLLINLPVCGINTFDVYLFGRLSDMLSQCEDLFERRVMELIDKRSLQQQQTLHRTVELMLHRNILRPIHTLAFEKIHLNQKFAFDYFLNVIIINVLTCLQYYICSNALLKA